MKQFYIKLKKRIAFSCFLLIKSFIYLKERSKENETWEKCEKE